MINDCIDIENNIKYINDININIKKNNLNNNKNIRFTPEENDINIFLEKIKTFGKINKKFQFKWKPGFNYKLSEDYLIATKISGGSSYNCNILGDIILPKNEINNWKIKLKNYYIKGWDILIGVGPSNLNQNEENLYNKTWTFICGYSKLSLQSGSPRDYNGNIGKIKEGDIIEVIMNTMNGELSFSVNDINYGSACKIPMNIDLSPFIK